MTIAIELLTRSEEITYLNIPIILSLQPSKCSFVLCFRGVSKGSVFFIIVVVLSIGIIAYFVVKGKRPGETHSAVTGPAFEPFTCSKTTEFLDRLAMKTVTDLSSRPNATSDIMVEVCHIYLTKLHRHLLISP